MAPLSLRLSIALAAVVGAIQPAIAEKAEKAEKVSKVERPRIVVVGAGYGGLEVARNLARDRSIQVVLIDKSPQHTAVTRLHERAAKGTAISADLTKVAEEMGVQYVRGEVTGIDSAGQTVQLRGGKLAYDSLVVAVGAETAYPDVPGLARHALGLRTAQDAGRVRAAVTRALDKVARARSPEARRALGRIVVGGAGPTGVELAAELAEALPDLARERGIDPADLSVVLIQRSEVLSSAGFLTDGDRTRARRALEKMGVQVMTGTQLRSVAGDHVEIDGQGGRQRLPSSVVVWTGGVRAPRALAGWGLPLEPKSGRIAVDASLQVTGMKGVFAIGDAAAVAGQGGELAAMTAQEAIAQATVAAGNARALLRGRSLKTYAPRSRGMLISLGRHGGIGRLLGLRVSGRVAAGLKRAIDLRQERRVGPSRVWQRAGRTRPAPRPVRAR